MGMDTEIRGFRKVWCWPGPLVNPWKLSGLSLMFLGARMELQADDGCVDPHPHREMDFPQLGTSSALIPKSCLQDNYIPTELKLNPNGNLALKAKISKSCSVGGERIDLGARLFAEECGSEGGMEREGLGSFSRLVHAPGILHGLGLGLILALPCKVAEGDEELHGFSELIPGDRRALE